MHLIIPAFIFLIGICLSDAGYGVRAPSSDTQSDVQAPAYTPPYLKNQKFTKNSYPRSYGTKTYPGRKTFTKTKSPYGTKSAYAQDKTWHTNYGAAPSYHDFQNNANSKYTELCRPSCQNNGICVGVNTCQCPANYYGRFCEFEKKPCVSYPPLPMNSKRKCSDEYCTVTCMDGHKFLDGSSVANIQCINGEWKPTRADFTVIPDCEPECNPKCQNGGACLAVNTCSCPADFRGPQCQYAASVCDVRKLSFNGAYRCSGDAEKFSCRLTCPSGAAYSSPPAKLYTCLYATGQFQPQPIPHCVFNDVVVITPSNYQETTIEGNRTRYTEVTSDHGENTPTEPEKYGPEPPASIVVQDFTPKGGNCLTWAGLHYKTFDGKIYSFESPCQHILVRDAKDHKYTVAIRRGECKRQSYCPTELTIYLEDKPYVLSVGEDGSVLFRSTKRLLPIPASLPGIRVQMPSDQVQVNLDALGVAIKWDTNNMILVEGSVLLWNNTEGLCGSLDGNQANDFTTKSGKLAKTKTVMASSWQLDKIGDICDTNPVENTACASKSAEEIKNALHFCVKLFSKEKFRKCFKVMDISLLIEACQWDYCACSSSLNSEECACSTVSVYAKECLRHDVQEMRNWRDDDTCPMKCPAGKVYKWCGPDVQPSCQFPAVSAVEAATCVEGCFCPEGLVAEAGRCVLPADCPCRLRNKTFQPGAVVPKDCNTCTCEAGSWTCTAVPCGARCSASGDPHYTTFDGLKYNFMGRCTYEFLRTDNLTIEVENVECYTAITEAMNLTPDKSLGKPSCTKAVNIVYGGVSIHLKQGGLVLANGEEVTKLPVIIGDVRIRAASSLFLIIQMPNKVDLWWDGNNRVYVDVPPELHGKTKGLCGTFNLNQKDDFLTPEGDIEQSALAFANKWKTREFCEDLSTEEPEHPCKANMQNKEAAEKYCSKLKSKLFEECHWYVDVESYYEDCLYDMCACQGDVAKCLCPVLGDYAMVCAKNGVKIHWRYDVKECELSCTGGQEYSVCADSCLRKCSDVALSSSGSCKPKCVEGCACPPGQALDDNSVCVPLGLCPCYHKGMQFDAGYKEVRPGRRERELCTCIGARWECKPASPEEIQNYPPAEDIRSNCSAASHMEFTTCELAEPLTCKNMHIPTSTTTAECRPGCQCKKGYVLDTVSKKCVLATQCPCHHGGRSYADGETMQEECNKCECKNGNWTCTDRKCAGLCSAWGDSHITTFDGADYDFEGVCTYLLAKGMMDSNDGFVVEIQNAPCGTTGATCSKSLTLKVGSGNNEEIVSLTKNAPIPDLSKLKRIKLRVAGSYVFLDVLSLGMSLQWDRGLRVYVKVDSMWQGRVKGLCGNYNSDLRDDFQSPGGGIPEASALIFADSWKLKPTCPKPQASTDHCIQRPERKEWAHGVCSAMKRHPFSLCHSEVPVGDYVERCERDACACDAGEDCACACAALAAYATACAHRGLTFKWRTQEQCPMQCDEECSSYSDCVSACPPETCDNTLEYDKLKGSCAQDTCVEGCKPKKACGDGEVYKNSSLTSCVPRSECKPVCMVLEDGREVAEGGVLEEDRCHTCRCSKKQRVCTGQPCSTSTTPEPATEATSPRPHDEPLKCVPGWTAWLSRGTPVAGPYGESTEIEPLPTPHELAIGSPMCKKENMTKIECRTVKEHVGAKESGFNAECSLETGLDCREQENLCPDFEIRVYCDCSEAPFQCVNSERPSVPHPTDCSQFYECSPDARNPDKPHTALKSCAAGTLYNPAAMVCDWPAAVLALRPECRETTTSTTVTLEIEESSPTIPPVEVSTSGPCPPGQVYSDCLYPCDHLCDYFKKSFQDKRQCLIGDKCVSGCVDNSKADKTCEPGLVWRDNTTCVKPKDCTCYSDGDIVKPGGVVTDGCIKCQCLNNELHCDSNECVSIGVPPSGLTHAPMISPTTPETTVPPTTPTTIPPTTILPTTVPPTTAPPTTVPPTTVPPTTVPPTTVPPTTVPPTTVPPTTVPPTTAAPIITTPPPECSPDMYKNLLWGDEPLPESAFTASSVANDMFQPFYAQLNGRPHDVSAGSWSPSTMDREQYIQVELPHSQPIYGVIMQGSPLFNHYVKNYEVLYSDDGNNFKTIDEANGKPKVFNGPATKYDTETEVLSPPVVGKFVRIRPVSWHDEIALRFELIGCEQPISTTPEEISTTESTEATTSIPTTTVLIIKNTATPPPECSPYSYIDLMMGDQPPPDTSFTASSVLNDNSKPQYALMDDKPNAWSPKTLDANQFIQVELPRSEPIYGIKLQGSPNSDHYVTSYQILYSDDGNVFSVVEGSDNKPKVFRGPISHTEVKKQMIEPPIEAKYVRLRPLTWNDWIAVKFELIGCQEPLTTTPESPVTTPEPLQCTEPLGLGAELPVDNIEVSSNNEARRHFLLEGERGWRPLYSTPGEWIMFDFTSPRNITGVKTKGGEKGWVTAYNIMYTSDLSTFNPVIDETGETKLFPANFDQDSVVITMFRPPIHARYLKVLPIKWKDNIEMRVEPIGCFEPYPTTATLPPEVTTPLQVECFVCPGVLTSSGVCKCNTTAAPYYDGDQCVTRDQCPCVQSFMTYPVGSTFRGANCDDCVCKLGGVTHCRPANECKCASNLVPKLDGETCECRCEPCPAGSKICPTSKMCLPLDKWCDGLQDCPDDERDCTTTTLTTPTTVTEPTVVTTVAPTVAITVPTTTTTTAPKPEPCPKVECPPGYLVRYTSSSSRYSHSSTSDLPPPRPRYSYDRFRKGGSAKGGRSYTKTAFPNTGYAKGRYGTGPRPSQSFTLDKPSSTLPPSSNASAPCPQFRCVPPLPPPPPPGSTPPPRVCDAPVCPPHYTLKLETVSAGDHCPQYVCVPPPERPVFCNMTGRTFNTFDGAEYKYDVCFHILARENRLDSWAILVRKKCRLEGCTNELMISQDDQLILVKPTMMIEYDNYEYTVEQTAKICFRKNSFDVVRVGNGVAIKSRKYKFMVLYNKDGDVKVGVDKSYQGSVDGLCGWYDGDVSNDRRLPSGRVTASLQEFAHSWAKPGLPPDACRTKVVTDDKQRKVWELCNAITQEPLSQVGKSLDLDKWRSICLEKICECAGTVVNGTKRTEEQCRCLILEQMVAEYLAANKHADLPAWRLKLDCPAECPLPLVHYDCYRKSCEPTCTEVGSSVACPVQDGICFPGCYCPEGKLRKGDQCVAPPDCLDCKCTGTGAPANYKTFEGDELPFPGNCTYLASRNRNATGQHKYEVYSTNGPCEGSTSSAAVCTQAVHILHNKNVVHVTKDKNTGKLVTTVGGSQVFTYPKKEEWGTITLVNGQDVLVSIPDIHVEVRVLQSKLEFRVVVSSYLYANQTEGLCGVCAGYMEHLTTSNGTATDDYDEYAKSWQATPDTLTTLEVPPQEQCQELPPEEPCVPPPPETNPCYNLYNADKFGPCHALVEPAGHVAACEAALCALNTSDACAALAAYAALCRAHGVCLHWRGDLCPYPCESPLVYRPCVDCERTCLNNDELEKEPGKCDTEPVEGCFCPPGKVRVDKKCVEPSKCFPCDLYGEHYAGEEWQKDKCTTCSCVRVGSGNDTRMSCSSQVCRFPICGVDEDMVTVPALPGACCDTYNCVPKPKNNESCGEPQKIECGFGQVLKLRTGGDGCTEFYCDCKAASECEPLPELPTPLEAGVERFVDTTSCCPRLRLLCKPETCPPPPSCPQFHRLQPNNVTGKCCLQYSCELPKDKCVVTLQWEAAAKGGEKARSPPEVTLKDMGSAWLDGPCRSCLCESTSLGPAARCSVTSCPAVASTEQFVLEPAPLPFACCPVPVYTACRHLHNIYRPGENWTSPDDACESYVCQETKDNKLEKVTTLQKCDEDCQPGWKYFPTEDRSVQCCGKCKPVACVVDGVQRAIGDTWQSDDFCRNFTCADVNGTLQVQCSNETCPEVPAAVRKQFVLKEDKIPGKCCPTQEPVACRVDNLIYQEGQSWPSPDPCKNMTCSRDSAGRLAHAESVQSCARDCKPGWKYQDPPTGQCCGHCVQQDCVLEDQLKPPGSTWQSADNCTTFSCDKMGVEVYVTSSRQACPDVSECDPEDLFNETCCQVCREKPEALSKCVPTSVGSDSVGLIRVSHRTRGLCVNTQPLNKFKECRGSCDSGTLFNNQTGSHDPKCECCQATRYESVTVTLQCDDGTAISHRVASPNKCACKACGGTVSAWPTKSATTGYSGIKTSPKPHYVEPDDYDAVPQIYQRFQTEKPLT